MAVSKTKEDRYMVGVRHVVGDLGLISEVDIKTITGLDDLQLAEWREGSTGFPTIRIGLNYFYPVETARQLIENIVGGKS